MRITNFVLFAGFSALLTSPAQAEVDINSFLTVGAATMSEDGSYLDKVSDNVTLENDSHYGLNLRTQATDKVTAAAQLLATSTNGNFNVDAEWAYVSYQFTPDFSLRAGKLNLVTFLLSDYSTVGYLHPWVRPPVEVYNNNPLRNFLGLELLHLNRFGRTAKLTSQFFVGSGQVEEGAMLVRANDGIGVNFQLDTPGFTLRAGAISPRVQLEAPDPNTGIYSEVFDQDERAMMYTLGASIDTGGFIMYAEALSRDADGETRAVFAKQDGAYVTFGYNMGKWLPHVTFGTASGENFDYTTGTSNLDALCGGAGCFQGGDMAALPVTQDSVALGLKYTVDDSVAFKIEVQQVDLTADKGDGFASLPENAVTPNSIDSFTVVSFAMDAIF